MPLRKKYQIKIQCHQTVRTVKNQLKVKNLWITKMKFRVPKRKQSDWRCSIWHGHCSRRLKKKIISSCKWYHADFSFLPKVQVSHHGHEYLCWLCHYLLAYYRTPALATGQYRNLGHCNSPLAWTGNHNPAVFSAAIHMVIQSALQAELKTSCFGGFWTDQCL